MASLRGAINAKCRECIYDPQAPGTWRKQVQDCTSPGCPLYEVRPVSAYGEDGAENGQNGATVQVGD